MPFETFAGSISVDAVGQLPVAYLARQTENQIAILDTLTLTAPVEFAIIRSHVITFEGNKTETIKRARRLFVFGTGQITSGFIILTADNARSQTYPYSGVNIGGTFPSRGQLICQGIMGLKGFTFDATLILFGININVNRFELEATEVG